MALGLPSSLYIKTLNEPMDKGRYRHHGSKYPLDKMYRIRYALSVAGRRLGWPERKGKTMLEHSELWETAVLLAMKGFQP